MTFRRTLSSPLQQETPRRLVLVIFANTFLSILLYTTDVQVNHDSAVVVTLQVVTGIFFLLGTPLLTARLWTSVRLDAKPDERQLALRNRAFRLSYHVVLWSAFAVLTYVLIKLDELGCYRVGLPGSCIEHVINRWYIVCVFGVLWLFAALLPTFIRAWLEPDPIQEETAYSVQKGSAT